MGKLKLLWPTKDGTVVQTGDRLMLRAAGEQATHVCFFDGSLLLGTEQAADGVCSLRIPAPAPGIHEIRAEGLCGDTRLWSDMVRLQTVPKDTTYGPYSQEEMVVACKPGHIRVYVKAADGADDRYIRYNLRHIRGLPGFPSTDSDGLGNYNSDLWRLYRAEVMRREGRFAFRNVYGYNGHVVNEGEWECALLEQGMPDFIGGFHGDERMTGSALWIDGERLEEGKTLLRPCREVRFEQSSVMYRCNTDQQAALHHKHYRWTADGLELSQQVEFLLPMTLREAYLAMLPVARKLHGCTGAQITDRARYGTDGDTADVGEERFVHPIGKWQSGITQAHVWGQASGLHTSVTVEYMPRLPGMRFRLDGRPQYNKFYFDFAGDGYRVSAGERWSSRTLYRLEIR